MYFTYKIHFIVKIYICNTPSIVGHCEYHIKIICACSVTSECYFVLYCVYNIFSMSMEHAVLFIVNRHVYYQSRLALIMYVLVNETDAFQRLNFGSAGLLM